MVRYNKNKLTIMYRWRPNIGKLPCDGKSCPHYRTADDGLNYCDFYERLHNRWYLIGAISCPIKMA